VKDEKSCPFVRGEKGLDNFQSHLFMKDYCQQCSEHYSLHGSADLNLLLFAYLEKMAKLAEIFGWKKRGKLRCRFCYSV